MQKSNINAIHFTTIIAGHQQLSQVFHECCHFNNEAV